MQPKEHDSGVPVPPAEDPPSVPTGWAAYAAAVRAAPDAAPRDSDRLASQARITRSARPTRTSAPVRPCLAGVDQGLTLWHDVPLFNWLHRPPSGAFPERRTGDRRSDEGADRQSAHEDGNP